MSFSLQRHHGGLFGDPARVTIARSIQPYSRSCRQGAQVPSVLVTDVLMMVPCDHGQSNFGGLGYCHRHLRPGTLISHHVDWHWSTWLFVHPPHCVGGGVQLAQFLVGAGNSAPHPTWRQQGQASCYIWGIASLHSGPSGMNQTEQHPVLLEVHQGRLRCLSIDAHEADIFSSIPKELVLYFITHQQWLRHRPWSTKSVHSGYSPRGQSWRVGWRYGCLDQAAALFWLLKMN